MNYHFSSVTSPSLSRYLYYRSSTNTVSYWTLSQFHIRLKLTTRPNCTRTALISRHFYSTFSIFQRTMSTSNNQLSKETPPPPSGQDSHSHVHSHSHDSEHLHSHSAAGMLHHHKHSMHEPNELLAGGASAIKTNPAVRITWIGLLVNVTLAISKGVGGVYFHSQALVADAIHSVSDMLADFLTLATVNVAAKVGTATKFPLGYGKLETVGAFSVSAILLFAGISVGWSSLLQIFEFVLPTHLYEIASHIHIGHDHSHSHSHVQAQPDAHSHGHIDPSNITTHREIPNINAAWLAGGSIIAKELLYRKTMKVAIQTNSKVLVANAWHHRVDSLTAVVALFTVAGGVLFNVAWLDSIGGIGVSILIIKAGYDSLREAWNELIDRGERPGSELYNKIEGIINNELQMNNELKQFKLNQLSVLSSGANTNIHINLSTTNQNLNLKTLNQYEKRLSDLIRQDDRFVRNIFVKFEQVEEEQEKVKTQEEEEEINGSNDVHSHKH
ncbi:conserved hypothetical protein [Candida dubliniensis CD36]|uniref:Cation efflux protein transmembrane domain-containing protein n=1 Tax=Candida dubliniensis (strain CD36 / ATCC MYA-646 / CBS 7987 / NCPF 3949 / NRRL Y-17841) TaxID=573826 RepID=B9W7R9_CANDC|nr:conserved hypothetical protein [Candida dubliniensis CD36]CAX44730.1 conserved hypothetical protein [Candida dubliniensis CD36]